MSDATRVPFRHIVYVVIERVDSPLRGHVEQMFWSGSDSDFDHQGLAFAWRGQSISIRRTFSLEAATQLQGYGNSVEISNALGTKFRVTGFATSLEANRHVSAAASLARTASP